MCCLGNYPEVIPMLVLPDHLEAVGLRQHIMSSIKNLVGSPMLFELFSAVKEWIDSHPFSMNTGPVVTKKSPVKESPPQNICKFFAKGNCRFGDKCRNYHPGSKSSQSKQEKNKNLVPVTSSEESVNVTEESDSSAQRNDPKQNESKKGSMRTAADVISRILWDPDLKTEEFTIGYLDRFVGIIEKPFSAFSWEDLATVGPKVLAIPKHRIQYFKYRDEVVWDKREQLDNVFGSRGGKVVQDIIEAYTLKQSSSDEKMRSGAVDAEMGKEDIPPSNQQHMHQDRPTHFVCIHITNEGIISNVQRIQEHIVSQYPHLGEGCLPLTALHVTMCMVQLEKTSHLDTARKVLEDAKKHFIQYLPRCTDLVFTGVDHFRGRLVYAKVLPNTALNKFSSYLIEHFKNAGLKTPGNHEKFTPHMTLVKMSRPMQRDVHTTIIDERSYCQFSEMDIGKQCINTIHLCSKIDPIQPEDGFYKRLHSVSNSLVYLSPTVPSILSKCVHQLQKNHLIDEIEGDKLINSTSESSSTTNFDSAIKTIYQLVHMNKQMLNSWKSKVVIMRGLPGSGKSYLSNHCSEEDIAICSADDYFNEAGGTYNFNPRSLPKAHAKCCESFLQAVKDEKKVVIVDNTNSMIWEYKLYIYLCKLLGIEYHILEIPHPSHDIASKYSSRNLHKVNATSIKLLTDRWEADDRAVLVPPKLVYPQSADSTLEVPNLSLLSLYHPGYLPEKFRAAVTPLVPVYVGIFLTPKSQWELVSSVPPSHPKILADHVTLTFMPPLSAIKRMSIGKRVPVTVRGVADSSQIQAVTVDLPKGVHSINLHPHITVSMEKTSAPKFANEMLRSQPVTPLPNPLQLEGIVGVVVREALPEELKPEGEVTVSKDLSEAETYTVLSKKHFMGEIVPRLLPDQISARIRDTGSKTSPDAVSICMGVQKVTKLYIFDFDGTLFDTPDPVAGQQLYEKSMGHRWPHKGWLSRPESLLPPLRIHPGPALPDYRSHFGRAESYTVILTARLQRVEEAVRRVLTDHQLSADLLILKSYDAQEASPAFKARSLSKLLEKFPDVTLVKFWDDRKDNLEAVRQFSLIPRKRKIDFEIIDSTCITQSVPLPESSKSAIGTFLITRGLLPSPEHTAAAQAGIQFIGSQFCKITGFQGDPSAITLVFGSHVLGRRSDVDLCFLAPPEFTQFDCLEKLADQMEKCGITHIHKGYSSRCPRLKLMLQFKNTPSIDYDIIFAILSSSEVFNSSSRSPVKSLRDNLEKVLRADDQASRTALSGPILQEKIEGILKDFVTCEMFGVIVEMTVQVLAAQRLKGNSFHCIRTFHVVKLLAEFIKSHRDHYPDKEATINCDTLFKKFVTHTSLLPTSKWQKLFGDFVPFEYIPRISDMFKKLAKICERKDVLPASCYEEMMVRPDFPPQGYIPVKLLFDASEQALEWELLTLVEARLPKFIRQLFSCGLDVVADGNNYTSGLSFAVQDTPSTKKTLQDIFRKFWNEFSDYKNQNGVQLELKFDGSADLRLTTEKVVDGTTSDVIKQVTAFASSGSSEFHFPPTLSSYERLLVHETAERLRISHKTMGSGNERHIVIHK